MGKPIDFYERKIFLRDFSLSDMKKGEHMIIKKLETDGMHIAVDREMKTNIEGCFACGDCTGRPYQYMKAAGEGNIAAHSVVDYLAK